MTVKIFWDPEGFEFDRLGRTTVSGTPADGDTPNVRVAIRLLSVDTAETAFPGVGKPSNSDEDLAELAHWIRQGQAPVDDALAEHLYPRLATGVAGTLQQTQGEAAKAFLHNLMEQRLAKDNGRKRTLFLRSANQHFDHHGRLLAYMAPAFSKSELARMSRSERSTFNLLMVESGWAATLIIFPALARYEDITLFHAAARLACEEGRGAWAEKMMLTGYEWRMCTRLHRITKRVIAGDTLNGHDREAWIQRYCMDLTTLEVTSPQHYHRIAPYNRVFIWPRDVNRAVSQLNLLPMGTA